MTLDTLDDDTLICVFSFLSVPEIIIMRQVSRRMLNISKLRIIWHNACTAHIIQQGYPFPGIPLDSTESSELENRTRHAYRLGIKWLSSSSNPRTTVVFDANSSIAISEVRFVPGRKNWFLTVSKGIWSVLTVWDIEGAVPRKISDWSLKGAVFSGLALTSDSDSDVAVAVSVSQDGHQRIEILSLSCHGNDPRATFQVTATLACGHQPKTFKGELLAASDDVSETVVWNWKDETTAVLRHTEEPTVGRWTYDRCIQVVFAHQSVLVVRARSIHLFPEPTLQASEIRTVYEPMISHSFGWIDGVSVAPKRLFPNPAAETDMQPFESLNILVRSESDNPWAAGAHTLDLYTLNPNPAFSISPHIGATQDDESSSNPPPYIFPPVLSTQVQSSRDYLRCTDIALGRHGTAVWLQPRDRAVSGLISSGAHLQDIPASDLPTSRESLVGAVFPGPLRERGIVMVRHLLSNAFGDWTSLDYDEDLGRIALGSSFGRVTILEL